MSTPSIRPVGDDEWDLVGWLWQAYRSDMAPIVNGLPYADGRYSHGLLDAYPAPDRTGYLAWQPHPNTGADAPVGFALVSGLGGPRRHMDAFWTAPVARRGGLGMSLAAHVVAQHPGPWTIAFQDGNDAATGFWRRVAGKLFGPEGEAWTEELRPVPGKPEIPPDHWIETGP
ncbi:MAG TPA: GNAT family N-acetyltransferase [Nocardioides sp.]|uniref:GNAT family N-acetyltransferase n=1 Tax=Nocardioides sp. TaxID=35761 RepID=UPI002E2F0F19|nr:GNAT family N-acetyltransferase [Nocardioides sp.]HEX5086957.1 GNAT family N-acetyltransferase [Nocardioides sp.]